MRWTVAITTQFPNMQCAQYHHAARTSPSPREARAGRGLGRWVRLRGMYELGKPLSLALSPLLRRRERESAHFLRGGTDEMRCASESLAAPRVKIPSD